MLETIIGRGMGGSWVFLFHFGPFLDYIITDGNWEKHYDYFDNKIQPLSIQLVLEIANFESSILLNFS